MSRSSGSTRIALLGAESTGKTTLAAELADRLRRDGRTAVVVPEVLRQWCTAARRPPRPEEQMGIAQDQERQVDLAAAQADVVIADTTALMVAIDGGMLYEDGSLYRFALARLHRYDHLLLTGLDLPWTPDGLMRSGPGDREEVDVLIRSALARAGVRYQVIYGRGGERLASALMALATHGAVPAADPVEAGESAPAGAVEAPSWITGCEKCGDARCEHRLFTGLL